MIDRENYFDNAATTPIDERVLAAMLPYLKEDFGNANSLHELGRRAGDAVERAREHVAALIGAEDPQQITFTSGSTEANQWVLAFPNCAVSPFEHSSIYEVVRHRGIGAFLKHNGLGITPANEAYDLVSVMAVNNEIGSLFHPSAAKGKARRVHSDLTQAAGKIPFQLDGLDYASLSAHKIHGPKGIGALYSRELPPPPMMIGEQERGFRGGTLNVAGIVGFGEAARIANLEEAQNLEHVTNLRQQLVESLQDVPDMKLNGGECVSPYILSLSFLGVEGESLVIDLDRQSYAISSGAACSSKSLEPSHVLLALNTEPGWIRSTIRISLSRYNSSSSVRLLSQNLKRSVEILRTMGRA
ncbi:MAG: cysteine desulfurase [Armatimonadetes bacterium]|nr:cysteine desulfurase [Armatimonadota bacterium]